MASSARKTTSKGGRPTLFEKRHIEEGRKLALLRLTDAQIAKVWGVSERTIAGWKTAHPEFLQAIARAREIADGDIAASLYERAKGYSHPEVLVHVHQGKVIKTKVTKHYPPDVQAISLFLRNRHPALWRAQPDPTDGSDDAPPPTKVVFQVIDARKRPDDAKPE